MSDNIAPIQDKEATGEGARRVPSTGIVLVICGLLLTVLWVAGMLWAMLVGVEWLWTWL